MGMNPDEIEAVAAEAAAETEAAIKADEARAEEEGADAVEIAKGA